jgi:alpha-tubulin suppressor-like RCC1 family protein
LELSGFEWPTATPTFTPAEGVFTAPGDIILECTTSDALIHYTTDGSEPTEGDPAIASGGSVHLDRSTTLRARAWAPDLAPSNIATAVYEFRVADVVIEPGGGLYTELQTVTMISATPDAEIHYSTDGTEPTLASPVYGSPLLIDTYTVLRARGFREGWTESDVTTATYTFNFGVLGAPVIEPPGGTHLSSVSVTLSAAAGAEIRYTLDGSDPGLGSDLYVAPIILDHSAILKAVALHADWTSSPVASADFEIKVETPSFTPAAGTYADPQDVAITTATPGAVITYTVDGTDPDEDSTELPAGETVTIDETLTLKARAFKPGLSPSDIATAEYVLEVPEVAAVAAGSTHSIVLKPDGTVWTWGGNASGQLGDGTNEPRVLPAQVFDGVKAIAAGGQHSLAVTRDGHVWAWGENSDGQLGDGTDESRTTPVLVPDLEEVVAVAAGSRHSLALKVDGTVWGWGANDSGQLADDTDDGPRITPVRVGLLANVRAIAAGGDRGVVIDGNGIARWWGGGSFYFVDTGLDQVETIAAGEGHMLAVRSDETIWAWGMNDSGQLGDDTDYTRFEPAQVLWGACGGGGGGGEGSAIAADAPEFDCLPMEGALAPAGGAVHSLGVLVDGDVYAWGDNSSGQLGALTGEPAWTALPVYGLGNVVQIAAGAFHSLAVTADGEVWAWGRNNDGQLGDGTTENRYLPVPIADADYAWRVATPIFSPPGGIFHTTPNIDVFCATPGVTIYYTLDGSEPTAESHRWPDGGTLFFSVSSILKAKAFLEDRESNTATAYYTLAVQSPVITPPGGDFDAPVNATVSVDTPGAIIHYSLDGTQPTENHPVIASGGSIPVTYSLTLRVRAFREGWSPAESQASFRILVLRPELDPPAGTYEEELDVAITTPTSGATVRYTTDGTQPTMESPVLEPGETIHVGESMTIRAQAFRSDLPASDVASASYGLRVQPPVSNPGGGTYDEPQWVWMASPTPEAVVRYTLDDSWPTESSPVAKAPILVDTSMTLRARAFRAGWEGSDAASAEYDFGAARVASPVFSPPPSSFATARPVRIDCPTEGSIVRYTTNGLDPTETDTELACGESIFVDATTMLKARAWRDGLPESFVRSGFYAVTGAVAAGGEFTLLLKADGTVWSWGRNNRGQLGDRTLEDRRQPVAVEGLPGIVAITAGHAHALALDADGSVWAWGNNAYGQLGNGSEGGYSTVPLRIEGLAPVIAISSGFAHNLAILSTQTVMGWGNNSSYQVGYGASDTQTTPRPVSSYYLGPATRIFAGGNGSFAMWAGRYGVLKAWGANPSGQLGFDSQGRSVGTPTTLSFDGAGILAVGPYQTLAIRDSGTGVGSLWTWGRGDHVPAEVSGLDRAVAVSVGQDHNLALDEWGQLWAWGGNGNGQLGMGSIGGSSSAPLPVVQGMDVVQIAAGALHTAAIKADGTVWTWGYNNFGQLGDGTLDVMRPTPQPIDGLVAAPNTWVGEDPDGDGLTSGREQVLGCNPFVADTNEDGIADGLAIELGLSCSSPDVDGDGLFNAEELEIGTSPFIADTDGDGAGDAVDCYPLDPTRFECEPPNPGDVEPPTITLTYPPGAVLISSHP